MARKMGIKPMANNKKAFHDYFVEERFECGMELKGTEVKSMRQGRMNLKESFATVKDGEVIAQLQLEIAGLMSDRPLAEVNEDLENAKAAALSLGVCRDIDPFMTLSFMSLPVIPTLRLTTRGVVDVATQQYV